eukprot:GHUV01058070.1.p1 GENE.GHUV01058070.1~~GHUV01058070.1.p1  ORF type:complete len:149 (-),score=15.06 GHUV01058070.1:18-464(-)
MVYWGCGTPKNRCIWALFTLSAVAGSVLIIAGAARLDICSKLPVYVHISGACDAAPRAVTVIGVFVLLATIPCLLFFSGCARGPSQTKYPTEVSTCMMPLRVFVCSSNTANAAFAVSLSREKRVCCPIKALQDEHKCSNGCIDFQTFA